VHTARQQHLAAGVERRTGGAHVVNEHDDTITETARGSAGSKRASHIFVPTGGREVCLHACGACSLERVDDR
jgi:hypothetical protein